MLHGMSMCSSGRLNGEKSTLKLNRRVLCSRRYAVKVPVEGDDEWALGPYIAAPTLGPTVGD